VSVLVIAAVPADGGVILAALPSAEEDQGCVVKGASGLATRLEGGPSFLSREPDLESAEGGTAPGHAVIVFREQEGERRRVYRGSLAAADSVAAERLSEAELRLQWALEEEAGVEARVRAVVSVLGWLAQQIEQAGPDAEVGIHEEGCRFSVDRMRWGEE
jgi:hypothetical protein